jgi:uncharacterized protein YceK
MVRVALVVVCGLALSGCVTTSTMTCPPDASFSAESQKRLAAEMRAAVPEAEWPEYIKSYSRIRKACRALANLR